MKKKVLDLLFLSLLSVLPLRGEALNVGENLTGVILKSNLKKNKFILNRGLEDGIHEKDIAKFYLNKKYFCHAVAVISEEGQSEWAVYKFANKKLMIPNTPISLRALYPSGHKIHIVNFQEFKKNSLIAHLREQTEIEKINSENLKQIQLEKDLEKYPRFKIPNLKISLEASPLSLRSIPKEKSFKASTHLENLEKKDYLLHFLYDYNFFSFHSVFHQQKFQSHQHWSQLSYQYFNFWKKLDYFALASFQRITDGPFAPLEAEVAFAPFGLKYYFWNQSSSENLAVSYNPEFTFDSREEEIFLVNNIRDSKNIREFFLRHAFRLFFKTKLRADLRVENLLEWKPYQSFETAHLDLDDHDFLEKVSLIFDYSENFSISLNGQYSIDERRRSSLYRSQEAWESSFFFRYSFATSSPHASANLSKLSKGPNKP